MPLLLGVVSRNPLPKSFSLLPHFYIAGHLPSRNIRLSLLRSLVPYGKKMALEAPTVGFGGSFDICDDGDVILVIRRKETRLRVHLQILRCSSSVFAKMFNPPLGGEPEPLQRFAARNSSTRG